MPTDPTTAAELHALVSQWPEEERPQKVEYKNLWHADCLPIILSHAIDLHIASGIRWLNSEDLSLSITTDRDGNPAAQIGSGVWHIALTLFLALHAAVMSTKEKT